MADDVGKQRLRPFLEAQINSGKIEGLQWLNHQKTKFRIPWWHGGKPDWKPDRGQIFKEWALHTGRYREGIDPEDWVGWKTRLRCALNKAADIVECKSESHVKTDESDPYKVYELRQRQQRGKKKAVAANHTRAAATEVTVSRVEGMPAGAPVPAFLNKYELASDDQIQERIPSDLNEVSESDLIRPATDIQVSQMSFTEADNSTLGNLLDVPLSPAEASTHLELVLYYANKPVWKKDVENPNGCRIFYGDGNLINEIESFPNLIQVVFGENAAETFWLPPVQDLMSSNMVSMVQNVLERGMQGGVLLQCIDSNIVAYRLCKCSIFYASSIGTSGEPRKLPLVLREKETVNVEPTVIFDYSAGFLPALTNYGLFGGQMPDPRVFLLIGTEKKLSDIDETVPIYVTVACRRALQDLQNVSTAMAQRQSQPKTDIDDVVNEVRQMSLESIDMPPEIPGYKLTPDPNLLPGNFIDPAAFQGGPGIDEQYFNMDFAADQNVDMPVRFDGVDFPATIDAGVWSQLAEPGTLDLSDLSDLIVFQTQ